MKITLQLRCILFCQSTVSFSTSQLYHKCFSYSAFSYSAFLTVLSYNAFLIFHSNRITFFCGTFALRMKTTLQLSFVFVCHCDVFFITSQLGYLFVWCSHVFCDVRIRLYFGTFELRMEITLQLRFVFVCHCDVFFIRSQLGYLFVRCSYIF